MTSIKKTRITEKLYQSQLLLSHLIDSSYDGITIMDPSGRIIWHNKAYLRISGLAPHLLDTLTVDEVMEKGFVKLAVSKEAFIHKKTITKLNQYSTGIEALVTSTPVMDEEGNLLFVISNIRDLTELNRLKRQLDETNSLTESFRKTLQEMQVPSMDGKQIIYRSPTMEKIVSLAQKVSSIDTPVLILGESGVGKDVLANYIHFISDRHDKGPFVKVNCGAIPENLLESELFGYEPGAFTGAARRGKAGLFEVADKGTLFLDEIGEMPLSLQVKLLGVLQDMKIQRVGGTKSIPIDVRIIAATNANLEELIQAKKFREDLFFRINVLPTHIPPLRERPEDIFVLLMHFLKMFNKKHGREKAFPPHVIDQLLAYSWPGNVRELRNVVERLVILSDDDFIHESLLPPTIYQNKPSPVSQNIGAARAPKHSLKEMVNEYEKTLLASYLTTYRPMKRCAEILQIDLATLVRKKKKFGL
ncbi:sigma 54-interacting transcriptional regulator [Brevibacillus ruminantium]|uniref:HTH-type transcriptional regulatory protein TyrR n=1 Tax=Brevibacillus ruminantium TaxID=2950604 RepID=A0ABY4WI64_9BACL|nr:sigma 54-interacting transcriptional regulator [Brevibacillus ruminantium]USG65717.1 sigma 54-interacting transcriptional regulator [Brevibacillus ruminantium]